MTDELTIRLSREEADALLNAWGIEEYCDGARLPVLDRAEAKLRAVLQTVRDTNDSEEPANGR